MAAKPPSAAAPPPSKSVPSSLPKLTPVAAVPISNSLAARLAARKAAAVAATPISNSVAARLAARLAATAAPAPAKVNTSAKFKELIKDCKTPDEELLKLLPDAKNLNEVINDTDAIEDYTALSFAIRCGKLEVADKIIDNMTSKKQLPSIYHNRLQIITPLSEAVRKADIAAIKLLNDKWFSLFDVRYLIGDERKYLDSIFTRTLNKLPASRGVVEELVLSENLPYKDQDTLTIVIQKNLPDIVEFMIDNGAKPDGYIIRKETPLMVAILNNNIDMVRLLINKGANVNRDGGLHKYPIQYAVDKRNYDIISLLIDRGAIIPEELSNTISKITVNNNNTKRLISALYPHLTEQTALPSAAAAAIMNANKSVARPITMFEIHEEDGIPILTIPQGSLLYNSFHIGGLRNPATREFNLNAVLRTLGGLMPFASSVEETSTGLKISSCIDKLSQKFFYTNPTGGASLMYVHRDQIFNVTSTFQTKRNMRLALLMTPGPYHRLAESHKNAANTRHPALYQCNETTLENCDCAPLAEANNSFRYGRGDKCKFGFHYDVCISPEFLHAHHLDGHIAIAGGDSYETRFSEFQTIFDELMVSKKYKDLTNLIFNTCMSHDKGSENGRDIRGFPELVIQIFGTDWYDKHTSMRFEYEIPIDPADTSPDAKARALIRALLGFNSLREPTAAIPVQTPLQLIRVATEFNTYNFETGVTRENAPIANVTASNMYFRYYMSCLESYFNGDLLFIVDPRTGFLVRPGHLPPVKMADGTQLPYEAICFGSGTGKSELAISADARINKKSVWHSVWGANSAKNMLEYAPSDVPSNINITGGAQFRTRRRPKSVKRHTRRKPANKNATRSRTRTSVQRSTTRKSVMRSTTRKSMRASLRKESIELDRVYHMYMEEIRKQLNARNRNKK